MRLVRSIVRIREKEPCRNSIKPNAKGAEVKSIKRNDGRVSISRLGIRPFRILTIARAEKEAAATVARKREKKVSGCGIKKETDERVIKVKTAVNNGLLGITIPLSSALLRTFSPSQVELSGGRWR